MRSIVLGFLLILLSNIALSQQRDTTLRAYSDSTRAADSASLVRARLMADTLPVAIRMPDSLRHNRLVDTLLKICAFDPFNFHSTVQHQLHIGKQRASRPGWVIAVLLFLFVYTAILNRLIGKDILNVVEAFYLKRSLTKLTREDNLLTSWAYIFLFVLFGLTLGLYVYELTLYYNFSYTIDGFQLYLACALFVVMLFVAKIFILRIIGFIFDIERITGEYISILYLTYFNIAFIFLPVVVCFSLFPSSLMYSLLVVSIIIILAVVLIQYARSTLNIISDFVFPKVYLFVYLCALEICPILILIKALNL